MIARSSFLRTIAAAAGAAPLLATAPESGSNVTRYGVAEVREDIDFVWKTLLDVGADPFYSAKRSDVEARFAAARASVRKPCTLAEGWLAIAPQNSTGRRRQPIANVSCARDRGDVPPERMWGIPTFSRGAMREAARATVRNATARFRTLKMVGGQEIPLIDRSAACETGH